jgi:hypothetical protein
LIFFFSLCFSVSANGQLVTIIGGGGLSCGKWIAAVNESHKDQQRVFTQWVAGFTVSYNWYQDKSTNPPINQPDLETISLWLTTYCNNNPTHSTLHASAALIQHLGGEITTFRWKK